MKRIKYSEILELSNFETIRDTILMDGTIIYPTDTLYGLGCNFFSLSATKKINQLKERSPKPYSILVSDLQMLGMLVDDIPEIYNTVFESILPGRFTFLLYPSKKISSFLKKNQSKIGIRIPDKKKILELTKRLKVPLISTSVNKTGHPSIQNPDSMSDPFSEVDILIDAGELPESLGSTIIDLTEFPFQVLRKGDDIDKIKDLTNVLFKEYQ